MQSIARRSFQAFILISTCWASGAWDAASCDAQAPADTAKAKPRVPENAAPPRSAEPEEEALVTRVYNVTDLVIPKPVYRYEGTQVPAMGLERGYGWSGGMGGLGGGSMGGLGGGTMGGGGGGFFNVQDNPAQSGGMAGGGGQSAAAAPQSGGQGGMPQGSVPPAGAGLPTGLGFTIEDLAKVIRDSIDRESWSEAGGPGTVLRLGGMLVISQTPANHEKIRTLLDSIRESSEGQRIVTVRARWLLLESKQLQQITQGRAAENARIDRAALDAIAGRAKGYQGEVSCFDGQTVHIVSGRHKSLVVSAIPVAGSEVGYQPVIATPQTGLLLQVTPQLLPKSQTVVLDLQSVFTQTSDAGRPVPFLSSGSAGGRAEAEPAGAGFRIRGKAPAPSQTTITLDRLDMVVQQFATTVKLPLGQIMLVGGLTVEPPADATWTADQVPQLYLFIETTAR